MSAAATKKPKPPAVSWEVTPRPAIGQRAIHSNYALAVRREDDEEVDARLLKNPAANPMPIWRWLVHYRPPNNGPDRKSFSFTEENAKRSAVKALAALLVEQP